MKSKFEQLCSTIDYNTYNKIRKILGISGIGIACTNNFFLSEYPTLDNSIDILAYFTVFVYLILAYSNGQNYTSDIKEIQNLYQEFLQNYHKLNKTFDLNNPIQIQTMFNYLLYKGYLSQNKSFEFSTKKTTNIKSILGSSIFTGNGVCRHISAMLGDILKSNNIASGQLTVYKMGLNLCVEILEEPKYAPEELTKWLKINLKDEETYNLGIKLLKELVYIRKENIEFEKEFEKGNIIERLVGNHAITFAVQDGFGYYLDPTSNSIYKINTNYTNSLCDDTFSKIPIKLISSLVLNDFQTYIKMCQNIAKQLPSLSLEEEKTMISKTQEICQNNLAIFEQFYSENKDLYNEISSRVLRIENKKV